MIFKILIILCFLNFASCELNKRIEKIKEVTIEPRIVGGYRPLHLSLAKFVVSIRLRDEMENHFGYKHFCSGSIVAANKILTAAHCVYRSDKKKTAHLFKIVAKTPIRLNRTSMTQEFNVKKVLIHPKYSDDTLLNDIAVLILEKDILLDSRFAAKISLPKQNFKVEKRCTVIGWGRLYMNGPLANEILFVNLNLHSRNYCRRRHPEFSGKKICASDIYDSEKDACVGDSGGPLICVLTGIVSYGYGCASGNAGIYTNVFRYVNWINHAGQSINPCLFLMMLSLFVHLD